MKDQQINRAARIAMDIMGAICDADEEAVREGFPERIREYCEREGVLDGMEVHRLREELMQEAGLEERSFFYKEIGIRIRPKEQFIEQEDEVHRTENCSILFQIGKSFWQGHLGWPFYIDLHLEEDGEWKLDELWIREYLIR
ncbi:MAG: hypothetical protein MR332_14485 [Fusicatenibacter sp.]|nr:hypothetical protein [Fusicatenibacter sp.]